MTGTDVARWNGPTNPAELYLYAETLASSGLLPGAFRGKAANVFYACEMARALDIPGVVALAGLHVIDGKPTASAGLMSALIRRDGHKLRTKKTGSIRGGDYTVTTTLIRIDDPDWVFEATWDLDRALRAELIDRIEVDQNGRHTVIARTKDGKAAAWEKYTEALLKARTVSEVAREGAEDSLCGVRYTPEELGANVDEDGNVIRGEEQLATVTVMSARVDPQPQVDEPTIPQQRQPEAPAYDERLAEAVAKTLDSASGDDIRDTWKATPPGVRDLDVTAYLPDDITETARVAGVAPERWTLGGLMTACAQHLARQGGLRLADAAVLDAEDDDDTPVDVEATDLEGAAA